MKDYYLKQTGPGVQEILDQVGLNKEAIDNIRADVDDHLDANSVNPVQNKVVTEALDNIQGGVDKEYNPAEFSGLGKVYLKKNIIEIGGVEKNVLTQSAFYKDGTQTPNTDTVFVVQYDFDLNGETVNVPARCVLEFDGGSITNGKIISNSTRFAGKFDPSIVWGLMYNEEGHIINHNGGSTELYAKPIWGEFSNNMSYFLADVEANGGIQAVLVTDDNVLMFIPYPLEEHKGVIYVYDRNFNFVGYTKIYEPCHYSGATLYDGYIYTARTTDKGCLKIRLSDVLYDCTHNHSTASEVVFDTIDGYQVWLVGVDYDKYSNTFMLCTIDTQLYQITPDGTVVFSEPAQDRYSPNSRYSQIANYLGDDMFIQDILFVKGYLWFSAWLGGEKQNTLDTPAFRRTSTMILYDYINNRIVDSSSLTINGSCFELEGVCMHDGKLYASAITHVRSDAVMQCRILELVDSEAKTFNSFETNIGDSGITYVYIDNSYRGISYGTGTKPFKTLGEAICMTPELSYIEFSIKYTGQPYYNYYSNFRNRSAYFTNRGNGTVVIDGFWDIMFGKLRFNGIDFKNTKTLDNTIIDAVMCDVQFNNCTMDITGSVLSGISLQQSRVYQTGPLTFSSSAEIYDETPSYSPVSKPPRHGMFAQGACDIYIGSNITFDRVIGIRGGACCDANVVLNNYSLVTLIKGWFLGAYGVKCKYPHSLTSLAQVEAISSLIEYTDPFTFFFETAANITLADGSVLPKGIYESFYSGWTNKVTFKSPWDYGHLSPLGMRGPSIARLSPDVHLEPGAFYFDEDLNSPVWRNKSNNGWVDGNGIATEFRIDVLKLDATEAERTITLGFDEAYRIIPIGSTCTVNGQAVSTFVEGRGNATIIVSNENYSIWVAGVGRLTSISHPSYFDSNAPEKCPIGIDMSQLDVSPITQMFSYNIRQWGTLTNKSITLLNVASTENEATRNAKANFEFDITGLPLTSLKAACCARFTGDLSTLSALYTAGGLSVYKTGISGEINDFAAAQVLLGKTGTINISAVLSDMTDDGNDITVAYIQGKGGSTGYNILIDFDSSYPNGYRKRYS